MSYMLEANKFVDFMFIIIILEGEWENGNLNKTLT